MSVMSAPDAVAITFAGQCDRGRVREENQDSVLHRSTQLGDLMVVADGIGGYAGGGVASYMAVETISASVAGMPAFFPAEIALEEAICHANAAIAAAASEPGSPHNRMGSTVVAALLRTEQDRAQAPVQALIGHVGDSRAYLLHHGRLMQVTRDHSAVQELIDIESLAPEEAADHPDASMLTRCLGHKPNVRIDLREVALEVGDSLLLCSDGLWGYVPGQEIERVLSDPALDAEAASKTLLHLALAAGGHDNVGIQLARVGVPAIRGFSRTHFFAPELRFEPAARKPRFEPAAPVSRSEAAGSRSRFELAPTEQRFQPAAPRTVPLLRPEPPAASSAIPGPGDPLAPAARLAQASTLFPASAPPQASSVLLPKPAATIAQEPNPARYAESMMLPELIAVRGAESASAQSTPFAAHASAGPQIGVAQLAAAFLLAFAASGTLAYFALVNNWFGALHLAR